VALKGPKETAQGEALGCATPFEFSPEGAAWHARTFDQPGLLSESNPDFALSGLILCLMARPQGFALGYLIWPRRGRTSDGQPSWRHWGFSRQRYCVRWIIVVPLAA